MAIQNIKNVKISGIAACVPKTVERNAESPLFLSAQDADKFIENTGIVEKRVVSNDVCTSDLCYHAAEKLIADLEWNKEDIDCLVFITQTPDYVVPATSCILQSRLGLSKECHAFDVTLGCSAWVYGLSIIGALLSSGGFKKGLLLVGETTTKTKSVKDKSTYPLFGDAGSATAMEFSEGHTGINIHAGTDGSKYEAIYIPDGGFRNPVSEISLDMVTVEEGITRNRLQYIMDGAAVFTFTISTVPKSINKLMDHFNIDKESVDYLLLHQANKLIVDKISGKLKFESDKVPTSYANFGNTSCCSIPLTVVTTIREKMESEKLNLVACGFGGGLSWATAQFETENIVCPELIEI